MFRFTLFAMLALVFLNGSSTAQDKASDLEKLQGRWKLTEADDGGNLAIRKGFLKYTLVIKDHEMVREFSDGRSEAYGRFKIATDEVPKQIDFKAGGRRRHDRVGIYSIDEDTLVICFSSVAPADESRRPKDFVIGPGSE